jgi:hypothetical protein
MIPHVSENELALFASGDLNLWRTAMVRFHLAQCEGCREMADQFRADRKRVLQAASDLPPGVNWDRLAAEMTANIHLGLSAGECVAPRRRKAVMMSWRPAAVMAGVAVLLATGWWLNMPPSTTRALGRALNSVVHGRTMPSVPADESGLIVTADEKGIELHENGGSLGISQGSAPPLAVSVSMPGSASARYVDSDTGQVTITSVYAQ